MKALLESLVSGAPGVMRTKPASLLIHDAEGSTHAVSVVRNPIDGERSALAEMLRANDTGNRMVSELTTAAVSARLLARPPGFSEAVPWSLSVMAMRSPAEFVSADVDVRATAWFLNALGRGTVDAGVEDAQFRPTLGSGKPDSPLRITGFVADIDRRVADAAAEPFTVGAPIPLVGFNTGSGNAKYVYAFTAAFGADDDALLEKREHLIDQAALAFQGFDEASAAVLQRQHLPIALKTVRGRSTVIEHRAIQISTVPFDLAGMKPGLPARVRDLLGMGGSTLGTDERIEVEQYLHDLGTPAVAGMNVLYARCPLKDHGAKKTYVNASAPEVSVFCLGGHGGLGRQRWSARDLLDLARGGQR